MRKVILLSALGAITLVGADDAHKSRPQPPYSFSGTVSGASFTNMPTQASVDFGHGPGHNNPHNGPHPYSGTAPASLSPYWPAPTTSTSGSSTSTSGSTPPGLASFFSAYTATGPPLVSSTTAGAEEKEIDNAKDMVFTTDGEIITHSWVIPTTTGGGVTHSWVSASTVSITEVSRSVRNDAAVLAGRDVDHNPAKPSVTPGGLEGSNNPWASHFPTTGKGAMTSYSAQSPGHSGGGWHSMLHGPDTDSTTAEKRAEPHHTPHLGPGIKTILARDGGTVSLGPVPGPVIPSTSILQTSTLSKNNTKSQSTTLTYGGELSSSSTSEEWVLTETSIPHSTITVSVVLSARNDAQSPTASWGHAKSHRPQPTQPGHPTSAFHSGSPLPPSHSNNVRAALELTLSCKEPLTGPKGGTGSVDITQECVEAGWGCWEFGYLPGPKTDGWYEKCLTGCTCTITQHARRDEQHESAYTLPHSWTDTLTTIKTLPSVHKSPSNCQTKYQSHPVKTTKPSTTSNALDAPMQPPVARSPAAGQLSCMILKTSAPGQPLVPTNITNTCVDTGYYCSNNKVYWNQQKSSSSFYEECQVSCKCDGSVNISRDVDNVADTEDSDMSCKRGIAGTHGVTGYTDITGDCIKMGFYCYAGSVIIPPVTSGAEYNQCSAVCKCKDTTKMARGVDNADTLTFSTGPYHTITTFRPVTGTWPLSQAVVTDAPSMKVRRDEGDLPGLGPGPADMTITNPSTLARRDETLTKTERKTRSQKPGQSTTSITHPHGRPSDVPPSMEKRTSHAKCPSDSKLVTGKLGNTNAACCCPKDHPNFDGSDEPYVCLSTDGTSVEPYTPLDCTHGARQWGVCCEWS